MWKELLILKFLHILLIEVSQLVIWQKGKNVKDLTVRATRIKEALAVMLESHS